MAVIYTALSAAQFGRERGPPGGLLGQHHHPGAPGGFGGGASGEAASGSAEAEIGGEEGGEFAEEASGAAKGAPQGGRSVKAIRGGYINVH